MTDRLGNRGEIVVEEVIWLAGLCELVNARIFTREILERQGVSQRSGGILLIYSLTSGVWPGPSVVARHLDCSILWQLDCTI